MGVANRELELKLELTGDELGRIQALTALRDLAIGEPASQQLRSLYFDTLDRRLHAQGLSLRIRRVGERWVQTLKFETDVYGGTLSARRAGNDRRGAQARGARHPRQSSS